MSKHVRLKKAWSPSNKLQFDAGNVVGLKNTVADDLVKRGIAEYVGDDVRTLRYAAAVPVQAECFACAPDEPQAEYAPKNAKFSVDKKQ